MPVAVGVGLEEDSIGGILGGISGNGKGLREVQEVQNRAREEELFQLIKRSLTGRGPIPTVVLLGKI